MHTCARTRPNMRPSVRRVQFARARIRIPMVACTYLDAIRVPLRVQRLFGLSVFVHTADNQLRTSASITIGACLYIIAYLLAVVVSLLWIRSAGVDWPLARRHGYLWLIIATFEVGFTVGTYPVLLAFSLYTRPVQMAVLLRLHRLDERLSDTFAVDRRPFYARLVRNQNRQLIAWLLYYALLSGLLTALMSAHGYDAAGFALFAAAYQLEQCTTGLLTWTITNCVHVLADQFGALRTVQRTLMMRPPPPLADADGRTQLKRQLAVLMATFRDVCELIEQISDNMGAVFVLRYAHDFTLVTSQCYLVYWIVLENGARMDAATWALLGSVLLWMVQNVVRIGLTAMRMSQAVDEVSQFS